MADLTDAEIALLCDIGEYDLTKATEEEKSGVSRLLSAGYVEPAADTPGAGFRPTGKGMRFLSQRGAGLNEA